jgi:hypothetical protein
MVQSCIMQNDNKEDLLKNPFFDDQKSNNSVDRMLKRCIVDQQQDSPRHQDNLIKNFFNTNSSNDLLKEQSQKDKNNSINIKQVNSIIEEEKIN